MLNISKLKNNSVKKKTILKKGEYVGEIKHYPAATKEWFNSIYAYNKNTIKPLPSADIYVTSLIKSYFNLFNKDFENSVKLNIIRFKKRKDSMSRVLVGKPEFKHTNDKVIITLYVYNREIVKYINKIKNIQYFRFLDILKNYKLKNIKLKNRINSRIFKLKRNKLFSSVFKSQNIRKNRFFNSMFKFKDTSIFKEINKLKPIYVKFLKEIKELNLKYTNTLKHSFFKLEKFPIIYIIGDMLNNLKLYLSIKRLIFFNKSKFNSVHILPLKNLLQKVYKKTVEFNIVSLKNYSLNSSLLTQIMAKKLRDRKNRLLRILGIVMNRMDMPFRNRLEYPAKKRKLLKIQNMLIRENLINKSIKIIPYLKLIDKITLSNNILKKITYKKITQDKLNTLLTAIYSRQYTINYSKNKNMLFEKLRNLENTVLHRLNNKNICGIRIEASGRLSKRLIASRAVFKMRQKGTIRNINSSYRNMSAVLLRGQLTSNVDFSKSKNKTRIGAFGLKGWIGTI